MFIMKKNRVKLLSASALTLIALTGTAYGAELVNEPNSGQGSEEVQEEVEDSQVSDTPEEGVGEVNEGNTEEEGSQDSEEGVEKPDKEETGNEKVDGEDVEESPEEGDESDTEEATADETKESAEKESEESSETEEVDSSLVVPEEDLPISEQTGMLDFTEYHKIAKGRALPRPLTDAEVERFEELVFEGVYGEVREGVTDIDYELVKIYPSEYYIEEDALELKWHKYTEVYSELLTLEEQKEYLDSREAEKQEMLAEGYTYDEELGDFIAELSDDEGIHHGVDDPNDIEDVVSPDPVENDDVVQEIHYEEKAVLEDLSEYNGLTDKEFLNTYGANFLFRGVVQPDKFVQQEYELGDGLTLAVEAESVQDDGKDNIVLTWGVVKDPVRYETDLFGDSGEGQYNFTTNPEQLDTYIEGNVLNTGTATLRTDGEYTPSKVYIEYTDSNSVPHLYLLIADSILDGEEQKDFSRLVGYIEYGWTDDVEDEWVPEEPEEEGSGNENGSDTDTGSDTNTPDSGEENGSELPDWVRPIDKDNNGQISQEELVEAGYRSDEVEQEKHPLNQYLDSGEEQPNEEGVNDSGEETSEEFVQTGTAVLWGSILSGLGLGAIGTYFFKKSKKDKTDKEKKDE